MVSCKVYKMSFAICIVFLKQATQHSQPVAVANRCCHVPIFIVPVDEVDLHGVHLALHRVLGALSGVRAPVPVKLQEVKPAAIAN